MVTSKNRSFSTRHNDEQQSGMITIEALKELRYQGRTIKKGETFEVSRSEAKRLLTLDKSVYRIKNNL